MYDIYYSSIWHPVCFGTKLIAGAKVLRDAGVKNVWIDPFSDPQGTVCYPFNCSHPPLLSSPPPRRNSWLMSIKTTILCKKSWDTVSISNFFPFSDIFVFFSPPPPFQCCHGRKIYWKILHTQHWKGGGGNRQDSMQFHWKRGIYPRL